MLKPARSLEAILTPILSQEPVIPLMISIDVGRELFVIEKIADILASVNEPLTKDATFIPILDRQGESHET